MRRPLIGLTTEGPGSERRFWLLANYVDAVTQAGATAVLIPVMPAHSIETVIARLDGFVLTGGGDIDPGQYKQARHEQVAGVDSERDAFELILARHLLESDKPVLGICRGMQVLNVACGGTLVQHVPDRFGTEIVHRNDGQPGTMHEVSVEPDSRLADYLGVTRLQVSSTHHQAIDRLAPGWRIVARADDGLPEAMEHQNHSWAIAVQWHPERILDEAPQRRLFEAFVRAAAEMALDNVPAR